MFGLRDIVILFIVPNTRVDSKKELIAQVADALHEVLEYLLT